MNRQLTIALACAAILLTHCKKEKTAPEPQMPQLLKLFAQMVCEPAPLPQILLYRVYPPLLQVPHWALLDHAACTSGSGAVFSFLQ